MDENEQNRIIVWRIRNFPHHCGSYNGRIEFMESEDNSLQELSAFREGWMAAVEAINDMITKQQQENNS